MGTYTPQQLAVFSAILARCATARDWSASEEKGDDGPTVQEVQCLWFDGRLVIAGNHAESDAVRDFLNAWGVDDEASFLKCLAHADWLLSLPYTERKKTTGTAYNLAYSEQETKTLGLAPRPFTALTANEQQEACALLRGKPGALQDRRTGWWLRKFVGAGALGANPYKKPKAKYGVTMVDNALSNSDINVLNVGGDVHAELKLLAYVYACVRPNPGPYFGKALHVGGLKKTCDYCAAWIGHYAWMMETGNSMAVVLPHPDDRSMGSGAGRRPLDETAAVKKSAFLKALFSGEQNSMCTDVAALRPKPKKTDGATADPPT